MGVSKFIKKLPIISKIFGRRNSKLEKLNNRIGEMEEENRILSRNLIDLRLKVKKINNEKIKVVFVCHRPAVWESLRSVYDAMKNDESFDVTIVAIPNKKELPDKWLNHEIYESEGAEEFWKEYGCINGYNYETKEWFDLKSLNPDYVFFQQPYNITRCPKYKSWVVAKYAKIVFVPYGISIVAQGIFESIHPVDFMKDVSIYFATDKYNYEDIEELLINNGVYNTKVIISGFPRYDLFNYPVVKDSDIWKYCGVVKKFRIIWTPRWCTNEGNCNFFEYKDKILEYAKNDKEVEIVFRPHPQAFSEWNTTGELNENEQVIFREECNKSGIIIDEEGEYISKIRTADCFITDITSLMAEFLMTGKPIIYCEKGKRDKNYFTNIGNALRKGYYIANSWDEIVDRINKLKEKDDELMSIRENIIRKDIYLTSNGAGEYIKEMIKSDVGCN